MVREYKGQGDLPGGCQQTSRPLWGRERTRALPLAYRKLPAFWHAAPFCLMGERVCIDIPCAARSAFSLNSTTNASSHGCSGQSRMCPPGFAPVVLLIDRKIIMRSTSKNVACQNASAQTRKAHAGRRPATMSQTPWSKVAGYTREMLRAHAARCGAPSRRCSRRWPRRGRTRL